MANQSASSGNNIKALGANTFEQLQQLITELEKQYEQTVSRPVLPVNPEYERYQYSAPTDDEVRANAETELAAYKNSGESTAKNNIESERERLSADKATTAKSAEATKQELDSTYGAAKSAIENDVLKRGLARSSIAVNRVADVENSLAAKKSAVEEETAAKIATIDSELNSLSTKLTAALNDFNISYAAKLQERINELKSEREEKQLAALKYNNELTEKEAQAEVERTKNESEIYGNELDNAIKSKTLGTLLTEEEQKELYESVYNLVDEYFSSIDKVSAKRQLLNDDYYRNHLGDHYYYKIYDKYAR